jgi:lipoate-protein ligase B
LNVIDLGIRDYKEVWDIQKAIHRKRVEGQIQDTVLLVEHNHVITMGKSGKEKNILIPFKLLEQKGIAYYEIERGGDVTYHGPGQLVGYPIFNIKDHLIGIKPFIEKLEAIIIQALADFDIEGKMRNKMIGVWTEHGKICSVGVAVKRWVSYHGFALNVNTDLSFFDLIVPCGLQDVKMTTMQSIAGREVPVSDVKNTVIEKFGAVFNNKPKMRCLAEII